MNKNGTPLPHCTGCGQFANHLTEVPRPYRPVSDWDYFCWRCNEKYGMD